MAENLEVLEEYLAVLKGYTDQVGLA